MRKKYRYYLKDFLLTFHRIHSSIEWKCDSKLITFNKMFFAQSKNEKSICTFFFFYKVLCYLISCNTFQYYKIIWFAQNYEFNLTMAKNGKCVPEWCSICIFLCVGLCDGARTHAMKSNVENYINCEFSSSGKCQWITLFHSYY